MNHPKSSKSKMTADTAKLAESHVASVRDRLSRSASGYVRVSKFSALHRASLGLLIDRSEVEIFDSPLGPAYRLKEAKKPRKDKLNGNR